MITVYGAPPSRALRVVWMLEEMGLDYEMRPVDFANRFKDKDFLEVSPAGFLPGIRDGDVTLFESVAILDYLGRRYGPTPYCITRDDPRWPVYLQYLHFGEASLAAPMNVTMVSKYAKDEADRDNYGSRVAVDMCLNRAKVLIQQLARGPYMVGDQFTAADISCSYFMTFAGYFGFADRLDPVLVNYLDRLKARPAYQRAAAKSARLV